MRLLDLAVVRRMSFDHRVGFLLSFVDGSSSLEDILDMCGMQPHEALQALGALLEEGVIASSSRRSMMGESAIPRLPSTVRSETLSR